eukprot:TRINITY_DN72579_c0_g1_i1.p1 TRINITY_DN72579_c0_g1~~TRINITY_DN72579_c0_g1_i1.p1  ORF type:complete len:230 (+),score=64.55 TRINITY_DN72579_c0_g1_i1:247-936(+)
MSVEDGREIAVVIESGSSEDSKEADEEKASKTRKHADATRKKLKKKQKKKEKKSKTKKQGKQRTKSKERRKAKKKQSSSSSSNDQNESDAVELMEDPIDVAIRRAEQERSEAKRQRKALKKEEQFRRDVERGAERLALVRSLFGQKDEPQVYQKTLQALPDPVRPAPAMAAAGTKQMPASLPAPSERNESKARCPTIPEVGLQEMEQAEIQARLLTKCRGGRQHSGTNA